MKKYLNILLRSAALPFIWFVYLSTFLAGAVRYYYLKNPTTPPPLLKYLGSFFWHIAPFFSITFIAVLIFLMLNYIQNRKKTAPKFTFYVVGVSSVFTFLLSKYLLALEFSKYSNYLYSTYGVTQFSINWLANISLITILLFVSFICYERAPSLSRFSFSGRQIVGLLFLGILVHYSFLSFVKAKDYLSYSKFIFNQEFENYISIVKLKEVVPEDGTVVIPVQSSVWPDISNAPIVRYFLFPRTIVSSTYVTDQEKAADLGTIYFITLSHAGRDLWPVIDQEKRTIFFRPDKALSYSSLTVVSKGNEAVVYRIAFEK